jgi:hypothetical protein
MPTGTLSPVGPQQYLDDNGVPLAGGKIYTYEAGGTTPTTTYSNRALTVANTNPIILNAAGRCTISLADTVVYKYVLKTSADVTVWTQDGIEAVPGVFETSGQAFYFGGQSSSPITATSYTAGALYTALHPGTNIWSVDPDELQGTYRLTAVGVGDVAGSITVALVNLSDGDPDTPVSTVVLNSTTGEWEQSGSDITFPVGGATKQFGIKTKITAPVTSGFAWAISVVRTD